MPGDTLNLLESQILQNFLQIAILIILVVYVIFALLIVRQVDLMSRTLITSVSPIVKAVAIAHAGFAIGVTILMFGFL